MHFRMRCRGARSSIEADKYDKKIRDKKMISPLDQAIEKSEDRKIQKEPRIER